MKKSSKASRMAQPLAVIAVWAGLLGYVIPAAFATPPAVTATSAAAPSGAPAQRSPAGPRRAPAEARHARTSAQPGSAPEPMPERLFRRTENALVRVIQASQRARRVSVTLGRQSLARNQPFASVTPFRPVHPGTWTVRVAGAAQGREQRAVLRITPAPGASTTLVVLDGRGRLAVTALQARPDVGKRAASGAAVPPAARGSAGPGRPAPQAGRSPLTWLVLGGTGLLIPTRLPSSFMTIRPPVRGR